MDQFLKTLIQTSAAKASAFRPVARYFSGMDFLMYVNEDCSYRAERVDTYLTVLWHPQEERLVGIKLKGFKFLFAQLKAVVGDLKDEHFLPVVKVLELACVGGAAEMIMEKFASEKKARAEALYNQAREMLTAANDAVIDFEELKKAA